MRFAFWVLALPSACAWVAPAFFNVNKVNCERCRRKQSPRLAIAEAAPTSVALNTFHSWLWKSGVAEGDCYLRSGPSDCAGGRGLVVAKPIKSGQAVAVVPQDLALTAVSAKATGLWAYVKGVNDPCGSAGDAGLIALQLLWERSMGEKSKIKPWLDVLPQASDVRIPLLWEAELLDLADRSSTRRMKLLSDDLRADFDVLEAEVFAKHRATFPADAFSFEQLKWAVAVALSRSFYVEGELRMAPLIDFVNHGEVGTTEVQGGSMGIFGGKAVRLVAGKSYDIGDAFFASYGPRHAAEYLEDYGFVPEGAGNSCEIVLSAPANDRFGEDKEDVLELSGLGKGKAALRQTFDLTASGEPDPEMIQFLRLVMLGGMDAFLLEALFRNDVWTFVTLPISAANEGAVNNYLIKRCEEELARLASTAAADAELLRTTSSGGGGGGTVNDPRLAMLAKVRSCERAALQHTLEWCKRDNEALDRKEYYQERRLKELKLDRPLEDSEVADPMGGRREYDW